MSQLKSKVKTALLRLFPNVAQSRFVVIGKIKKAFYFLRYLPGSSRVYGPPRGIYKNAEEFNSLHTGERITDVLVKNGAVHRRKIPQSNSELVRGRFSAILETEIIAKHGYVLKDARYFYGNGGTVITSDDKIFLPASPLRNEWNYQLHQSLYRLALPATVQLDKVILVDTKACEDNYYHWLKDHITRFGWLREMDLDLSEYTLVTSNGSLPFQAYTLEVLKGNGFDFAEVHDAGVINSFAARELVIAPYTTIALNGDQITFDIASKNFLQEMFVKTQAGPVDGAEKIYLSRRRSNRTSEQESLLVEALSAFGVKEVFLEDYNVSQQAFLFNNAKVIIGFHGAGFTNLLFCKPGTKVFEIFGADFIVSDFWAIADLMGLDYYAYCDDEYFKGIGNYRLSRLSPTLINVQNLISYYKTVIGE